MDASQKSNVTPLTNTVGKWSTGGTAFEYTVPPYYPTYITVDKTEKAICIATKLMESKQVTVKTPQQLLDLINLIKQEL